ncbi:sensor histidine kinase, partial [Jatrophihabitans endophyticus]|uniref:sensor histidine kinase n=1 Tax=Jatrophihabitans endophyticus TaxID=1206085 RepID=UPI0019F35E3B
VANAVKFTPAGGAVRIECSFSDEQTVQLQIADTGIGIPPEDLPHLFSRFYRASNARTTETPGTGLGLSLARSIVEAHGGAIAVAANEPTGTVVTLTLPRHRT